MKRKPKDDISPSEMRGGIFRGMRDFAAGRYRPFADVQRDLESRCHTCGHAKSRHEGGIEECMEACNCQMFYDKT